MACRSHCIYGHYIYADDIQNLHAYGNAGDSCHPPLLWKRGGGHRRHGYIFRVPVLYNGKYNRIGSRYESDLRNELEAGIPYYATLAATGGPAWGELGKGLTHWTVAEGSLTTALAYISTNAAITAGIYGTYLGVEKKWKKEDLFNGIMLADAIAHVAAVILISGAIVLVGAIVLHPTGTAIKAPAQLGDLLIPFLGKAAPVVMGIALLAAGFSSLLGNTQRGMVLLAAGIDKPVGLETKFIRWGCLLCIAFAAVICYSYGGSPTQLIFIANIATAVATPFGGFFVCRLIFRRDVNAGLKTPRVLQICMVISYAFALIMTGSALWKMFFL